MTLDDAGLFDQGDGPRPGAAPRRPCRRHEWARAVGPGPVVESRLRCSRCGRPHDAAAARRGRTNRSRGNAIERDVARAVGGRRTGQFGGKEDVVTDGLFAFQVKSLATARFPGWMADQVDALRAARSDLEPVLVVAEAPGPGHRARRLYVVDEPTWLALHGRPLEEVP